MKVLPSLSFLARQAQAWRGDNDEINSNSHQVLLLHAEDQREKKKFTSPKIQNETIATTAQQIFIYIAVMIDEATDSSISKQLFVVLRWADDLSVHEDFIGSTKLLG